MGLEPNRQLVRGQPRQHAVHDHHRRPETQGRFQRFHPVGHFVSAVAQGFGDPPHVAPRRPVAGGHEHQGRPRLLGGAEEGQAEGEGRAAVGLTLHHETPAVRTDDAVADVETEARALHVGHPPRPHAREGAEEAVFVGARQAHPAVFHPHHHRLPLPAGEDADLAPIGRVLGGVRQEVLHDLGQAIPVGPGRQRVIGQVHAHRPLRVAGDAGDHFPDLGRHVGDRKLEGELPGLEPRRLQGLVHEVGHVGGRADDVLRPLHPVVERRLRLPLEELGIAQDPGEGGAEVVGHDVHELALHAVELHQPLVGLLKGPVEVGVAEQDTDPIGQGLQGDDLLAAEGAPAPAVHAEHGHDLVSREDGHGRAARSLGGLGFGEGGGEEGRVRLQARFPFRPGLGAQGPRAGPARGGVGQEDGDSRVAERLADAADGGLENALAGQAARDGPEQRVHEGELLAALPFGLEGHRVGHRDGELGGEAGEVLEIVGGEGGGSRPPRRVEDAEQHGGLTLLLVVDEGHAQEPGQRIAPGDVVGVGGHVVDERRHEVTGHPARDALAQPELGGSRPLRAQVPGPGHEEAQEARGLVDPEDRAVVGANQPPRLLRGLDEERTQVAQGRRFQAEVVEGRHLPRHALGGRLAVDPLERQGELAGHRGQQAHLLVRHRGLRGARQVEHAQHQIPRAHRHGQLGHGRMGRRG